ncbi:hypothetical protein [Alkalilimnicola ehrlichii]|uniref:hypothetical protein n=1 Tax=Alkalilimnicola ehrlichii TaxID=351052 RepID=UPI003B9DECAA
MAMRMKTRWFRHGHTRDPEQVGGAAAMLAWRMATQTVRDISEHGPVTDRAGGHLALVEELALFAVQMVDRLAWLRGVDDDHRRRLVAAMVERMSSGAAESVADPEAGVALVRRAHERLATYARAGYDGEMPGYAAFNCLGALGGRAAGHEDDVWLHAQLTEVEGPAMAERLHKAIGELLEPLISGAPAAAESAHQVNGEENR